MPDQLVYILLATILSLVVTKIVINLAKRWGILSLSYEGDDKGRRAVPLLGGVAIFVSLLVFLLIVLIFDERLTIGEITTWHYIGILLAGLIIVVGGALDDVYDLPPKYQIAFPLFAAIVAIAFGVGVEKMTNPFGGVILLEQIKYPFFAIGSHVVEFAFPGDIFTFLWLIGMMYTTKLLDAVDGLVTGISSIAAFMVMLLASTAAYLQPDVSLFSAILLGVLVGFLFWNFAPGRIFLGESGSVLCGFLVGLLAVISGGKIATALLVMGVPIIDTAWVIIRRLFWEGRSLAKGDEKHLHHRLIRAGLSKRQVLLFYYFVAAAFGVTTLFFQSREKLVALMILFVMVVLVAWFLVSRRSRRVS